ncbi:uncharacterized protein LOC107265443 [Cephus cinctus]|uniref:Uncharacterized protein LOC107265443 n=1 Tax=Cephus cinctus TaxID=211228 RepID=A0AAJ7FGA6_CEPCN|nr:uncharacterized protein LOC107265443 [Cephus cinctus]
MMNGNDISELSYKELQALALRYRVPGNIKKDLLIKILQAAKGGNEPEVGRLLTELKQTRKKRVRKAKHGELNLTSTPIHSPTYAMVEECYCPQQQPPYQWVGAEEVIVNREDEANRIPPYDEFRQYLLRRIHKEYQNCDMNNNANIVESQSIMDLRTAAEASTLDSITFEPSNARSNVIATGDLNTTTMQVAPDHIEYQIVEDPNANQRGPILLKKMLQAPVGADLGEIASPECAGYRIWSLEYQTGNNEMDNSDTLTADSQSNGNDENWINTTEYCRLINNVRDQIFLNPPHLTDKNIQEVNQFPGSLPSDNANQYQYGYQNLDVQQNCQKWIAANALEMREPNYLQPITENPRTFHTIYYQGVDTNYAVSKAINNDCSLYSYQTPNDVTLYDSSQNIMDTNVRDELQQYQNQNVAPVMQSVPDPMFYSQQIIKPVEESTGYFKQAPSDNFVQDLYTSNIQEMVSPQQEVTTNFYKYSKESTVSFTNIESNGTQYNTGFFNQYTTTHDSQQPDLSLVENTTAQQQQQQQQESITMEQVSNNIQTDMVSAMEVTQSQLNGVLDPYPPRSLVNNTTDYYLEHILNLRSNNYVDYTKIDQTSCVYCYTAPIVTQMTAPTSSGICSQKKRFIAENRQHTFLPYWMLYNDASTGMSMANVKEVLQEKSVVNLDTRIRDSTDDSEESIDNVWIDDYGNYQLSTEKHSQDIEVVVSEDATNPFFTDTLMDSNASQLDSICNVAEEG